MTATKASRKGTTPARSTHRSSLQGDGDDASQTMDETSEMMDPVVHYSEVADDEEPCTSSSILQTPGRSAARPKPDRRRTGREQSADSDASQDSLIGSPIRKTFYTIKDLHTSRPAERFRTDILAQIRTADSEYTPSVEEGCPSLKLTDRWREEWSHGVQVLLHPKNLPSFETRPCDIPHHSSGPFRLPAGKYLLSKSAPAYEREDTHVVYAAPPLRVYQGDRLDELWLERLNREKETAGLAPLDLATMLNLMNEFEIECFKNIHRIVLSQLSSPSSSARDVSADGVDEDAPCAVCLVSDCDDNDKMIFCDSCNVCLHISCYGMTEVPDGMWNCDMCRHVGFTRHDKLKCELCPNIGGPMKEVEKSNKQKWVHIACAMWIDTVRFANIKGHEVIGALSSVPDDRFALKCAICDLSRSGACLQCKWRGCATPFHATCGQRRKESYDVVHEPSAEDDFTMEFNGYCRKHTAMRRREKEGREGSQMVEQSDDETDERSEQVRNLERAFYLQVKCEDAAKKLSTSQLHASDVYEYWKQKRNENGGRPLIAGAQSEIEVDMEAPVLTLETADETVMLRASDDVQHQLTPFQLKCWRFQKHVFQTADRGRLGCDMIMKRERKKKDILDTSHELFRTIVELDAQPVPLSSRALAQIVEGLQQDMTPEEIAESDVIAEQMARWNPTASSSFAASASTSTSSPSKRRTVEAAGGAGDFPGLVKRRAPILASPSRELRPSAPSSPVAAAKENGVGGGEAAAAAAATTPTTAAATGRAASPAKNKRSGRRSLAPPASAAAAAAAHRAATPASGRASPSKTTASAAAGSVGRGRLRPQNPPDDLSSATAATVPSPRSRAPTVPPSSPPVAPSPSKLRERRDVKYR